MTKIFDTPKLFVLDSIDYEAIFDRHLKAAIVAAANEIDAQISTLTRYDPSHDGEIVAKRICVGLTVDTVDVPHIPGEIRVAPDASKFGAEPEDPVTA